LHHNATYQSHIKLPVYGNGGFVGIDNELITNKMNSDFKIYPNPAISELTLWGNNNEEAAYRIIDMYGKTILNGKFEKKTHLTLNIASGIYFVEIKAKNGQREVKKLVVN